MLLLYICVSKFVHKGFKICTKNYTRSSETNDDRLLHNHDEPGAMEEDFEENTSKVDL